MLILCSCGCGQQLYDFDKWHPYKKRRYIWGHQCRGRVPSEKTKQKISVSLSGKNSPLFGISFSEKHKQKISNSKKGGESPTFGKYGNLSHTWKGGRKIAVAKSNAKRKRMLGYMPLNFCEVDGWVGHHIDYNYVIFIPEELHKSVYHSVSKNKNMDIINDKVYGWFINYYFKGGIL